MPWLRQRRSSGPLFLIRIVNADAVLNAEEPRKAAEHEQPFDLRAWRIRARLGMRHCGREFSTCGREGREQRPGGGVARLRQCRIEPCQGTAADDCHDEQQRADGFENSEEKSRDTHDPAAPPGRSSLFPRPFSLPRLVSGGPPAGKWPNGAVDSTAGNLKSQLPSGTFALTSICE
jgi:hypothetical protein